MIWHIFKKDWKLLWIFVTTVALLYWISAFILLKQGLFGEDPMLAMLAESVPILADFASMFLIAAIVHLEAIPGVRQDWLVRPVGRGSLLLEKFLFVVVTVAGPIFAANVFQGLANGFSLRLSLLAAVEYVILHLFFTILPIFAFASVTRNMTEAFIFGCGCAFIIGAYLTIAHYINGAANGTPIALSHSGIGWIGEMFRFGLVALAASVILGLQYFRRKTVIARVFLIGFGLLILMSIFLPWRPAFAIQERLSSKPGAGKLTAIAFDPATGKFKSPYASASRNGRRGNGEDNVEVFLPLRIDGVHYDGILLTDRVEVRVIGQGGKAIYHGIGDALNVESHLPLSLGEVGRDLYQRIELPMSIYASARDQPVKVQLDYSLTVFGVSKSYAMPALGGDQRMPGWGLCRTKVNEAGTAVELRCIEPGDGPICGTVLLENTSRGKQNPGRFFCYSNYGPFRNDPLPDNFARFGTNLPFRDLTGLTKFPVDGAQLPQSRVVIRMYEPEDHFTRSLVIPQIKLQDWEAQ